MAEVRDIAAGEQVGTRSVVELQPVGEQFGDSARRPARSGFRIVQVGSGQAERPCGFA
ncbi:hypothetical protein OG235_31720 [Streptomyces sp. NBC_00024]